MNETKASGMFDEAKGKLKQAFGEATDNQSVANEGAADQVKGNAKETWGNVKDTAHEVTSGSSARTADGQAAATGTNLRTDVAEGAEHLKDSIERGLDNLEHKANR